MKPFIKNYFIFFFIAGAFASCSTDGIEDFTALQVIERVDFTISTETLTASNEAEVIFNEPDIIISEESSESDASFDIVSYKYLGNPSFHFKFNIQLGRDRLMSVTIFDRYDANPWTHVGVGFDGFAKEDLNGQSRYVKIDVYTQENGAMNTFSTDYISHDEAIINAFTIENHNNYSKEITCRINDANLVEQFSGESIALNGTFTGAITFE